MSGRGGGLGWWSKWALAVLVMAAAAGPIAWHYLVQWPQDQWQVDLEVYRSAGTSILYGRPIYDFLTEPPQLLPFTYPPFAAILAVPLALIPFGAAAWLWTAGQVAATYATVWIAGRPLLARAGSWRPVATAVFAGLLTWLHPVSDGIRFGQVNAFIVLVCLIDLASVRPRWARGALIGVMTAIKLTPGVFLIHFGLSRRWRAALGLLGGTVAATLLGLLVLPEASLAFWGGALQDPNRLGPNNGTSNQSIRGFLLRVGPSGAALSAVWVIAVLVVGAFALAVARRAHQRGLVAIEVGSVGLVAVLASPVAWIHHLAWLVVVIPAIVGDGRDRVRLGMGAVVTGWFLCRLPWWGVSWQTYHPATKWFGRMMQNADTVGAVLALVFLAVALARSPRLERQVDAGDLERGEAGEDEAERAADPADRREAQAAK